LLEVEVVALMWVAAAVRAVTKQAHYPWFEEPHTQSQSVLAVWHGLVIQVPLVEQALIQFLIPSLLRVVEAAARLIPMVILVGQVVALGLVTQEQELEALHLHLVKETLVVTRFQIAHSPYFLLVAVALMRQAVQVPILLLG
jgi:urease accessory protein UreF